MRSPEAVLRSIDASPLSIPFRVAFRHASAERSAMQSVHVRVTCADGSLGQGEGCPREYVTGESVGSALAFIGQRRAEWLERIHDVATLRDWIERRRGDIDAHPAAWCAVEVALLDVFGQRAGRPLESLLGVSAGSTRFQYTAILGDAPEAAFATQLRTYVAAGFTAFKVKLSGDSVRDRAKAAALRAARIDPACVRADANNVWRDPRIAIAHLRSLDYPFAAIEEPLAPGDLEGMRRVGEAAGAAIVLDESVARVSQIEGLASDPERWRVNVRVSKMGGVLRSLEVARAATAAGVRLVVGAHVGETSLLTRAALAVASAERAHVMGLEGAFGTHLLQHDIVAAPLMFGAGGVLDAGGAMGRPGLGLA